MNIQNAIAAALKATGYAVHFGYGPQQATAPYLVFAIVAGDDDVALGGPTGLSRRIVQVDAWAETAKAAKVMIDSATAKMTSSDKFTVDAIDVSAAPEYEPETKLSRDSLDFTIAFEP